MLLYFLMLVASSRKHSEQVFWCFLSSCFYCVVYPCHCRTITESNKKNKSCDILTISSKSKVGYNRFVDCFFCEASLSFLWEEKENVPRDFASSGTYRAIQSQNYCAVIIPILPLHCPTYLSTLFHKHVWVPPPDMVLKLNLASISVSSNNQGQQQTPSRSNFKLSTRWPAVVVVEIVVLPAAAKHKNLRDLWIVIILYADNKT